MKLHPATATDIRQSIGGITRGDRSERAHKIVLRQDEAARLARAGGTAAIHTRVAAALPPSLIDAILAQAAQHRKAVGVPTTNTTKSTPNNCLFYCHMQLPFVSKIAFSL